MVDCADSNTEFRSYAQSGLLDSLALLKLLDASIDVFSEQALHTLSQHDLSLFFLIR